MDAYPFTDSERERFRQSVPWTQRGGVGRDELYAMTTRLAIPIYGSPRPTKRQLLTALYTAMQLPYPLGLVNIDHFFPCMLRLFTDDEETDILSEQTPVPRLRQLATMQLIRWTNKQTTRAHLLQLVQQSRQRFPGRRRISDRDEDVESEESRGVRSSVQSPASRHESLDNIAETENAAAIDYRLNDIQQEITTLGEEIYELQLLSVRLSNPMMRKECLVKTQERTLRLQILTSELNG